MEEGEGRSSGIPTQKRQRRSNGTLNYTTSVENLSRKGKETLMAVNRKRYFKSTSALSRTSSTFFDGSSSSYRWLRPGWIVEERRMLSSNRLYRYYYDPVGQMYNTRQEVEHMWKAIDNPRDNPPDKNNRDNHQEKRNLDLIVLDD